ncbi:hypothetical protein FLA_5915 [Filimonas lacunae]|nr:hypothetical protein FLA_5915 [Filimonas lacunae]
MAQDKTIQNLQTEGSRAIKKDAADTTKKTWKKGGLFSLNLSQAALSNWSAGGDNFSMAITAYTNMFAFYKKGKHSWDNTLDINFGYVNTTSLGARKNDDRVDYLSKYGYELNEKLNLAGLFNFRTQMLRGYTYDGTERTFASTFLAPAYVTLSLGLDYHPVKNLSIFVSPVSSRWVIVKDDSLSARGMYGVDTGRHSKNEMGAYATINYTAKINDNVSYKGRMDLFSNYKHNPQNVDLYMTNLFAVKISRVLSATWSLDLIYDDDTKLFGPDKNSAGLQLKSVVGAGLLVKF